MSLKCIYELLHICEVPRNVKKYPKNLTTSIGLILASFSGDRGFKSSVLSSHIIPLAAKSLPPINQFESYQRTAPAEGTTLKV